MVKHTKYVLSILVVTALLTSPSISAVTMTQGTEDTSSETSVSSGEVPSTSLADITSTNQSETSETQTEATEEEDSNPVEKAETISDDSTTDTKTTTDGNWTYNTNTYELLSYEGSDIGSSANPVTIPAGADGQPFLITTNLTASLKEKNVLYLAIAAPSTESGNQEAYITSGASLFSGMNLVILDLTHLNTTSVTDMSYMFSQSARINDLILTELDTSSATNVSHMFAGCYNLQSLDLLHFDTSLVDDMSSMFSNCRSLQSIDISSFTPTSLVNMSNIFENCWNLRTIDFPSSEIIKANNISGMFVNCSKLSSLNLSFLNTESVTTMSNLFQGCENLENLQFGDQFKTDNINSMSQMFYNCQKLKTVDVSRFNTENVTSTQRMFYNCYELSELDVSHFNTEKMTMMENMFQNCKSLTTLDTSNFKGTRVGYTRWMFMGCSSLEKIDLSSFNSTAVEYRDMFTDCSSLHYIDLSSMRTRPDSRITDMFNTGSSELLVITSDKKLLSEYTYTTNPPTSTTLTATDGYTFTDGATEHQYLVDMGKENGNNGCAITPEQATAQGVKEWLTAQRPSVDDYYKMTSTATDDLWKTADVTNLSFEDTLKSTYDLIEGKVTVTVPNIEFGGHTLSPNTKYTQNQAVGLTEMVTVSDNRYTHSGWKLNVNSGSFADLPTVTLQFNQPNAKGQGVEAEDVKVIADSNGASVPVLSAASGNGKGETTLTWGEKTLSLPDVKQVKAGDYRATLTWTLSDTP